MTDEEIKEALDTVKHVKKLNNRGKYLDWIKFGMDPNTGADKRSTSLGPFSQRF